MTNREKAELDWLAGMSVKQLSEKYAINLSTLRSWVTRYWKPKHVKKKEKVATQNATQNATPHKNAIVLQGNQNAKGNKGGRPAKGNTNALTHGASAKKYMNILSPELINQALEYVSTDSEGVLKLQIEGLQIQEAYFLERIRLMTKQAVDDNEKPILAVEEYLKPLYSELSKVQRLIVHTIKALEAIRASKHRLDMESIKLLAGGSEDDIAPDSSNLLETLSLVSSDVWEEEEDG